MKKECACDYGRMTIITPIDDLSMALCGHKSSGRISKFLQDQFQELRLGRSRVTHDLQDKIYALDHNSIRDSMKWDREFKGRWLSNVRYTHVFDNNRDIFRNMADYLKSSFAELEPKLIGKKIEEGFPIIWQAMDSVNQDPKRIKHFTGSMYLYYIVDELTNDKYFLMLSEHIPPKNKWIDKFIAYILFSFLKKEKEWFVKHPLQDRSISEFGDIEKLITEAKNEWRERIEQHFNKA